MNSALSKNSGEFGLTCLDQGELLAASVINRLRVTVGCTLKGIVILF